MTWQYIAILISAVFFVAYSSMSLKLYSSHQTRGDLTAYAQGMWNTLHGNFMASTYNYSVHNYYDRVYREIDAGNSNIFGIHFNPILLLFIPIYSLFPTPETLLYIQSLLTALGGFIIYCLAKNILKNDPLSLIIQIAYLVYFATVSAVLNQFHAYTLTLFFAPLLILSSTHKNNFLYYTSLGLFLLVQENTSLIAFFFGFYLITSRTTRNRGIITAILALGYFYFTLYYLIPALSPYHYYLFSGIYGSTLGGSISEMIKNTLLHPSRLIQTIITSANINYLHHLLLGITPFAILSPLVLLVSFSSLAQNLLSSSLALKTQIMHYESGAVAFLFYALILGLNFFLIKTKFGLYRQGLFACSILLIVMTGYSYKKFTSPRFHPTLLKHSMYTDKNREMDIMINLIPPGVSVSTQDYLSAQLSNREGLYQFPVYLDQVDYILINTHDSTWPLTKEEQDGYITSLKNSDKFNTVSKTKNFILFSSIHD